VLRPPSLRCSSPWIENASRLGVRAISAREWLKRAYDSVGSNLYEAIRNNEGYRGIAAPQTLRHRYILEDVPMSLVPISELGRTFGVQTELIDAVICLASTIHGTDYRHNARTVESMGLSGRPYRRSSSMCKKGMYNRASHEGIGSRRPWGPRVRQGGRIEAERF